MWLRYLLPEPGQPALLPLLPPQHLHSPQSALQLTTQSNSHLVYLALVFVSVDLPHLLLNHLPIYTVIKQPRYIQYLELIVHKLGQEGGHVAFEVLEPVEIEIVLNKQE